MILKQEIPPWLSCSPSPITAPPPPIDPSSLILQDFHQNQDFHPNPSPSPSPSPSTSLGPTALPPYYHHHQPPQPPPHVSATALLQKAAQMGAKTSSSPMFSAVFSRPHQPGHVTPGPSPSDGFGPSRDHLVYADKAAAMTGGGGATHDQMMTMMTMMNNAAAAGFHQGPGFSHVDFDNGHRFHAAVNHQSISGGDNLTRDFLGLSQNDILSLTGFDSCINSNSCDENHNQTPKSW